jgi:hypothetical protein
VTLNELIESLESLRRSNPALGEAPVLVPEGYRHQTLVLPDIATEAVRIRVYGDQDAVLIHS